jgi:hypothetical protein
MAKDGMTFDQWLAQARIPDKKRTPELTAVLQSAFCVLESQGWDFASRRLVGHFLGHGQLGLKIAHIARLVGFSRPTASRHQSLSSRAVVREIQHQFSGRPYGKLLPRYAGPIAEFLVTHPQATREDVLDFVERTWQVRVSTVALHKFLKKYGLDRATRAEARAAQPTPADPLTDEAQLRIVLQEPPAPGLPLPVPREEFFLLPPSTRGPFCCCPKSSPGGRPPKTASAMTSAPCSPVF